jgi:hypothetical protein
VARRASAPGRERARRWVGKLVIIRGHKLFVFTTKEDIALFFNERPDHPITTVRSDHRLAEAPLRGAVGRPRVQAAIGRRQAKVIGEPQNPRQRCNTNRGMR